MKKLKANIKHVTSAPAIITERETDDYLNTEVKEYAYYVITTRALPNIMDGLRIGARKIMYAAITGKLKNGKKEKAPVLIGNSMELEFHHGDASLKNTIEQLGAKHLFEFAPLNVIGQTGSLRVPDVDTAARYLHVETNENIKLFKSDMDILTLNYEDGKFVEPKFFLPVVPIVLLWRTNSPGFGFSFRSFSHDIDNVIDATISALINGSCNDMHFVDIKPKIQGINPDNIIYNASKQSWYNVGEYAIDLAKDQIHITDLPYNVSYAKYEEHLIQLKDDNYIVDYKNLSAKNKINVTIQFARGRVAMFMKEQWKFYTKLKLFVKITKLTLNCIDTDGKSIIKFGSPQELVDGFVRRRLHFYGQRKSKLVETIDKTIVDLDDKARFIMLVLEEKLVINKRRIEDVKADCDKLGVTHNGLKLQVSRFTQTEIDKALNDIKDLKAELAYIKNTTTQQMYLNDLIALKEQVSEIKKVKI